MLQGDAFLESLIRGRYDHEFFGAVFLNRPPHPAQLEVLEEGNATVNVLPTSNRWGKTTLIPHIQFHSGIYKVGAESRFLDAEGILDQKKFEDTRYATVHGSHDWETASLVWDEMHKLIGENANLRPFIADAPRTLPPVIKFYNGAVCKFRSLANQARAVDGNSFYVITVDEAGWVEDLEYIMDNVLKIRVADVRGRIYLVGTMKPGISKDFHKYGVKAAAYTGVGAMLSHQGVDDEEDEQESLSGSIKKYCREFGIDIDELRAAMEEAEYA